MKVTEEQINSYWSIMVENQSKDVVKILTDLLTGTLSYDDFVKGTIDDVYDSFKDDYDEDEDY